MAEKGYNDLEATIDRLKKQKELCQELLKNAGFSVIKRQGSFTRKCMKDFGFKLLYW